MNITQLVRRAKLADRALEQIRDEDAAALLRAVFENIRKEIYATQEGMVKVIGLGQFRIAQKPRERSGTTEIVKRIAFRPDER